LHSNNLQELIPLFAEFIPRFSGTPN